ncbi:NAD(P)/FAD-dependent oxidoreductase [Flavobacterium sp. CYK-4]|uniref:NAD(P)/FAD-dependent oxidoreductase n=1 Tax=Flavobacterium lotistagni TaxID=2709660 RepID=UPI0014086F92|nr:NAD(P)/FAD-dependent oxidoreductase [Flavobacterium lotistagni]NHM08021.1 NAD(P)/FAD-dependent oxidoreductase [Flavobacterium lotistagni]
MKNEQNYEVIIIGGSYAGLAAAMALGRAARRVLVIDGRQPCNRQTPYSHNFITQDGVPPAIIAAKAREQVAMYDTVSFLTDDAEQAVKVPNGFEIGTKSGSRFTAQKLIFATGIADQFPAIEGMAASWGISVLHCPYCHGYEVKGQATGVLGNGDSGFDMVRMISHWTPNLTLFTNGKSTLTDQQASLLSRHQIDIETRPIEALQQQFGKISAIAFKDGTQKPIEVLYAKVDFVQHTDLPVSLGCALNASGYIQVDDLQKTSVPGIYACGDNSSRMRTVANAVATGTTAGMMLNKEMIEERFTE